MENSTELKEFMVGELMKINAKQGALKDYVKMLATITINEDVEQLLSIIDTEFSILDQITYDNFEKPLKELDEYRERVANGTL